ncbi:MAG: hypothetical protein AB7O67_13245 [Vicinamibacterales bacterium]
MGLLLVLIPWSAFWDRNYFLEGLPYVRDILTSNYARGAVTGLGLLNVWAALAELAELFTPRTPEDPLPPVPGDHGPA